jgi:hypothetical protein
LSIHPSAGKKELYSSLLPRQTQGRAALNLACCWDRSIDSVEGSHLHSVDGPNR